MFSIEKSCIFAAWFKTHENENDNENRLKMKEQVNKFEELAKPLMEYLHKNFHPHAQIIINWDGAEVVEGKIGVPYKED